MNAILKLFLDNSPRKALKEFSSIFGLRSGQQVRRDLLHLLLQSRKGYQFDLSTLGFARPDISLPTYLGWIPANGLAPIINNFDRIWGGKYYSGRVTRKNSKDFRGLPLTYDEHDGVDFACPIGSELVAAAPGYVVMIRDNWLRGGLTISVDHGGGLLTQYTHCWKSLVKLGQPVMRGEVLALSGSSGVDMVVSFPWLAPHLHFMVWDKGQPIDPFLKISEAAHNGCWEGGNSPKASKIRYNENLPELSPVDEYAVQELIPECQHKKVQAQLKALGDNPYYLAAFLEDSLQHDHYAWGDQWHGQKFRPTEMESSSVRISLPLSAALYKGAFFADDKISHLGFWKKD